MLAISIKNDWLEISKEHFRKTDILCIFISFISTTFIRHWYFHHAYFRHSLKTSFIVVYRWCKDCINYVHYSNPFWTQKRITSYRLCCSAQCSTPSSHNQIQFNHATPSYSAIIQCHHTMHSYHHPCFIYNFNSDCWDGPSKTLINDSW